MSNGVDDALALVEVGAEGEDAIDGDDAVNPDDELEEALSVFSLSLERSGLRGMKVEMEEVEVFGKGGGGSMSGLWV